MEAIEKLVKESEKLMEESTNSLSLLENYYRDLRVKQLGLSIHQALQAIYKQNEAIIAYLNK